MWLDDQRLREVAGDVTGEVEVVPDLWPAADLECVWSWGEQLAPARIYAGALVPDLRVVPALALVPMPWVDPAQR